MTFDYQPFCSDARGELHRHLIKDQRYKSVFTRAGNYRGGETHPHDKHVVIVSGTMELRWTVDGKEEIFDMPNNEAVTIASGTPHLFLSKTDTILIEWWPDTFEVEHYKPYRDLITNADKPE